MFELSVACKYLIPRWRQLSVSIISMISILVISLVVWLILVFFSVTNGLENNWIEKLIALTAPVRITPTQEYYDSYYYQIDSISEASDYTHKTLREKLAGVGVDPYDADFDEEVPLYWPQPDEDGEGNLKDIVKMAADAAGRLNIAGLTVAPYETSVGNIKLSSISESTYLGSFDPENLDLKKTLLPLSGDDLSNVLQTIGYANRKELREFFENVEVTHLKLQPGWRIPIHLYPKEGYLDVVAILRDGNVYQMFAAPKADQLLQIKAEWDERAAGFEIVKAPLKFEDRRPLLSIGGKQYPARTAPLQLAAEMEIPAKLEESSLALADSGGDVQFVMSLNLQEAAFEGSVPYKGLKIARADLCDQPKADVCWIYESDGQMVLPSVGGSDGILLPKTFREQGVLVGDRGQLTYYAPTTSSLQEQRLPIHVAGFYDQGVISIGGKLAFAGPEIVSAAGSAFNQNQGGMQAGINIRFRDWNKAEEAKEVLQAAFAEGGIGRYWKVETFREYPFTKDLLQQLRSEKNLFSLISIVIIIVACSNIVSMLIILVNDKKGEIGILRSMGASPKSIAAIFGFCGMVMGLLGSLVGIALAALTLKNIQSLIGLISRLQGHELFNVHFFGEVIPDRLSGEALAFVLMATVLISLISGVIPAIKASLMRPSAILRSE
jgi:lipoprotein-releasing system permease protein